MMQLSTGHLTRKTRELLEYECTIHDLSYYVLTYGFLVYIGNLDAASAEGFDKDLCDCIKAGLDAGAEWIQFDSDYEPVDDLPYYEED